MRGFGATSHTRFFLVAIMVTCTIGGLLQAANAIAPSASAIHTGRATITHVGQGLEPTILASPNGAHLWIAGEFPIWRSDDGGLTWTDASPPTVKGAFFDGWSIAQDAVGTLYATNTQGQDAYVATSRDAGDTWTMTATQMAVEVGVFADRPWVTARGDGEVALIANDIVGEVCDFSRDGAITFGHHALAPSQLGPTNAGNVVFDASGHVTYAAPSAIARWNGAATCTSDLVAGIQTLSLPPSGAYQELIQVTADAQGHYYVAVPTVDNSAIAIRAFRTWDASTFRELIVSPPTLRSNTFATITEREDGQIAVSWIGSENPGDPGDPSFVGSWNVYAARVDGFWTDQPEITIDQVTSGSMNEGFVNRQFFADYQGITYSANGDVLLAYNNALDKGDAYFARLASEP